jgi:type III pantothenate kinase
MIVAIDVGNTTTKFGFFEGKEPVFRLDITSDKELGVEDYWRPVHEALPPTTVIEGVILCSVVPAATPVLSKLSIEKLGQKPVILDSTTPIRLVNRYRPPKDVGGDRLANAFAVWKTYGAPAIIVDIGTAVTVDVLSEEGEYLGGVISPGVEMAAEALHRKTALLPHVTLQPVETVLGRDTLSAVRSGLTHGYAAMIAGLIQKLKDELGLPQRTTIVLTGGHVETFRDLLSELPLIVDTDLTLKGLNLIYWEIAEGADADSE